MEVNTLFLEFNLLIDKIEWRDGWPYVGAPSDEPKLAPIV